MKNYQVRVLLPGGDPGEVAKAPVLRYYTPSTPVTVPDVVELEAEHRDNNKKAGGPDKKLYKGLQRSASRD